ncbi:MAG: HAD-IA family hydrolase [Methylococcus sp.]
MKDRYDLLIFDWDGTLFDSIGWIVACLQQAARASGFAVPSDAAARSVIGLSLPQAMQTLYPGSSEDMAQRLVQHYRLLYHSPTATTLGLFEGIETLLLGFRRRGYRLAVATGKARAGLDRALRETGMNDIFHATRCADETASKPHPLMIHQLLEELAVPSARALLIGDSLHDLRMAQQAGIDAVAVACGANSRDELMELRPLHCLETTTELAQLFAMETA